MDVDNHCIELPEDFPQFPSKIHLIQELSEVLVHFGLSPQGGDPVSPSRGQLKSRALHDLVDDRRNGNLGGEALAVLERLQDLATRTGVAVGPVVPLERAGEAEGEPWTRVPGQEEELLEAQLTVQLREVFAARFANMFADYEAFVIQSANDLESWLTNREQMHNFDKVRPLPPFRHPNHTPPPLSQFAQVCSR